LVSFAMASRRGSDDDGAMLMGLKRSRQGGHGRNRKDKNEGGVGLPCKVEGAGEARRPGLVLAANLRSEDDGSAREPRAQRVNIGIIASCRW
jgi:hypothetical protein